MHVLVLWIRDGSPAEWQRWSMREEPASFGPARCHVHPSVVDDGVLDVHVDVASAADARRLRQIVARRCRENAGMTLEGAWIFPSPAPSTGRHGDSPCPPEPAVHNGNESRRSA
jgi:hypothetical protein